MFSTSITIIDNDDCEKFLKFLSENKIKYIKESPFYLAMLNEAEFRLYNYIEDIQNDPQYMYLVNNQDKVDKFIKKYINKLADEFYNSDYIFNNDEIIDITEDFIYNEISYKKKIRVHILKGLYKIKAHESMVEIAERLLCEKIITSKSFNKVVKKYKKELLKLFYKHKPDEKTIEYIIDDFHEYLVKKIYHKHMKVTLKK